MMDMSSVIDASLVFGGMAGVLLMAWGTLFSESNTVSTDKGAHTAPMVCEVRRSLRKAA